MGGVYLPFKFEAVAFDVRVLFTTFINAPITKIYTTTRTCYATCSHYLCGKHFANICLGFNI